MKPKEPESEGQDAEPIDPVVARGRRQAIAVAVSVLGSVLVIAVLGGTPPQLALLQLVISGLVLLQMFRGRAWARWLLAAFCAIAAVGNVVNAAQLYGHEGSPWLLSVGLAGIFGWCAFVLGFSAPFLAFAKARRAELD